MKEIKEQEVAKRILSSILKTKKFPPAFLFYGPPGVGKLSLALHFSAEILENKKKTLKGIHPDLSIVFPEFDGYEKSKIMNLRKRGEYFKLRNTKGSISIDTVRNIQDYVYITPMESKWKIVIIANFDRMTKEGFNGFLKILEEPPSNVIFILITPEKSVLPDTIISRTQNIRFTPISPDLQKHLLKETSIKRFGRGIEETSFLNSKKNLEKEVENLFFNKPPKIRIKNWSEKEKKKWKAELFLPYLQKLIEDKYKTKEIPFGKALDAFSHLKNAYKYYYSNITSEKIVFYLLLKI